MNEISLQETKKFKEILVYTIIFFTFNTISTVFSNLSPKEFINPLKNATPGLTMIAILSAKTILEKDVDSTQIKVIMHYCCEMYKLNTGHVYDTVNFPNCGGVEQILNKILMERSSKPLPKEIWQKVLYYSLSHLFTPQEFESIMKITDLHLTQIGYPVFFNNINPLDQS